MAELDGQKNEIKGTQKRLKRAECKLDNAVLKIDFQDKQRASILDFVKDQVVPVSKLVEDTARMRKEQ